MKTYDYLDENLSIDIRVEDLLGRMSIEEKVRQITCTIAMPHLPLEKQDLHSGMGSFTVMTSRDLAKDLRAVQEHVIANSPNGIPALIHGEALSGPTQIAGGNFFPAPINLGATFETDLAFKMSEGTKNQMYAYGIRHALSPVADLARDLRFGRVNEGYGGDPTLTAAMTVAFVQGLQGENLKDGIACTAKHFLGYSQSENGMNMHKSLVPARELREVFAKPFDAAIQLADIKSIMNCYSEVDGEPMCSNKRVLTDMLRDDIGFEGILVADYNSIRHLVDDFKIAKDLHDAAKQCLVAGLDVELPTSMGYNNEMIEAAKKGEVDIELINRSVRRLLKVKFELGLFEDPFPHEELIPSAMDNTENNKNGYETAVKSMTLMKNNGILPITDKDLKIAVIGPTGNSVRMMIGGYTHVALIEMLMSFPMTGETQPGVDFDQVLDEEEQAKLKKKPKSAFAELEKILSTSSISDKYMLDGMIKQMYPHASSIFEGLQVEFPNVTFHEGCDYKGDDDRNMAESIAAAKEADLVILTVGGKNGLGGSATTGETVDSSSLDLMGLQEQLMRDVHAVNSNIVIVHTDGRPLCSEWAYKNASAIIEGWLPATFAGKAVADVISGKVNPAGRTPIDIPRSVGHLPLYHYQNNGSSAVDNPGLIKTGYINSTSTALAPFGYGLSYTDFEYSDFNLIEVSTGVLEASVVVKNVGDLDGEEVVQLYGKDMLASLIRPRQELLGFKRISLKKGQSKKVTFEFQLDQMSFPNLDGQWILEEGDFKFFVGGHSDDARVTASYTQQETVKVNQRKRGFFAQVRYENLN